MEDDTNVLIPVIYVEKLQEFYIVFFLLVRNLYVNFKLKGEANYVKLGYQITNRVF